MWGGLNRKTLRLDVNIWGISADSARKLRGNKTQKMWKSGQNQTESSSNNSWWCFNSDVKDLLSADNNTAPLSSRRVSGRRHRRVTYWQTIQPIEAMTQKFDKFAFENVWVVINSDLNGIK